MKMIVGVALLTLSLSSIASTVKVTSFNYVRNQGDIHHPLAELCGRVEGMTTSPTFLNVKVDPGVQKVFNRAVQSGDMVVVERVLKLNTWVDFYLKDKHTALMKASANAKNIVMDALIAKGADVNKQDIDGNSSLHHLVKVLNKKTEAALLVLLKAKVNTSLKNINGESALDLAKKINAEAVKILVKNGIK